MAVNFWPRPVVAPTAFSRIDPLLGLAFAAAIMVLVASPYAPVMDLPNHLARIWLLAGGINHGGLNQAYQVDWAQTSSNVLVDLAGSWLLRLVSLDALEIILRGLLTIAPALGVAALAGALHGRISLWHGLALCVVWGETMAAGFVAFNAALGLATLLLACKLRFAPRLPPSWRALARVVAVLLAYACHPFGAVFYALLDLGCTLGGRLGDPGKTWRRLVRAGVQTYLPAAVAIGLVILMHRSASPLDSDGSIVFRGLRENLKSLYTPFEAYDRKAELLLKLPFAVLTGLALHRGWARVHAGLAVAIAIMLVAALLTPDVVGHAAWLRLRFPLMAALAGCAALAPHPEGETPVLRCLLLGTILLQLGWVHHVWQRRKDDMADLRSVASVIPPGSTVLAAEGPLTANPADDQLGKWVAFHYVRRHQAALLVPLAQARIPTLFAMPGQQPLRLTPAFAAISEGADVPHLADLASGQPHSLEPRRDTARWRCVYDYLLMLESAGAGAPREALTGIRPVRLTRSLRLFRVERPAQGCGSGPVNGPPGTG